MITRKNLRTLLVLLTLLTAETVFSQSQIGTGFFNNHIFATYSDPQCSRKMRGDYFYGDLNGNSFSFLVDDDGPINALSCGNTSGASVANTITPSGLPSNSGYPATVPSIDIAFKNNDAPSGYSTFEFNNHLEPMTTFFVMDVDYGHSLDIYFLDDSYSSIPINGNIKVVRLNAAANSPGNVITEGGSYINISSSGGNLNLPGWAFVILSSDVSKIQIQQSAGAWTNDTYRMTFSTGAPDRGDAPDTYGEALNVPLSPVIRIGNLGPDGDKVSHSINASTDDSPYPLSLNYLDDEDGVTYYNNIPNVGLDPQIINSYTIYAKVTNLSLDMLRTVAWLDWNNDGVFTADEGVMGDLVNSGSTDYQLMFTWNNVTFSAPGPILFTYLRIRVSTGYLDNNMPAGILPDGETEDYALKVNSQMVTGSQLYVNNIGAGYFNGHTFSTVDQADCTRKNQYGTFTGNLAGNHYSLVLGDVSPRNLTCGASVATVSGASSSPGFLPGAIPVNTGYPASYPHSIDFAYSNDDQPGSNYTTIDFDFPLDTLTNFMILDVDGPEMIEIEFLDASWNPLDIESNIKFIRLFNPMALPDASLELLNPTTALVYHRMPYFDNNPTFSFVTLNGNVQHIRMRQTGGGSGQSSYDVFFSKGFPDRGDAPASYGDAKNLPVSNLKLGSIGPDADPVSNFSATAGGDDSGNGSNVVDDDDGVSVIAPIPNSAANTQVIPVYTISATVTNTTGKDAWAIAWLDWDNNGVFDPGEGLVSVAIPTGSSNLPVSFTWNNVTLTGQTGTSNTFLRLRISTDPLTTADPVLFANDGETEDYLVPFATMLPVQLTAFTVRSSGCTNIVSASLAADNTAGEMVLEVSKNGSAFTEAGRIKADSTGLTNWTFNAPVSEAGNYIYRLRMNDPDGKFTFGPQVRVLNNCNSAVVLYPNPANENLEVLVPSNLVSTRYEILSSSLQQVRSDQVQSSHFVIPVSSLAPGVYFLRLADGVTRKFIRQ